MNFWGLRAIAIIEALKGGVAFLIAVGVYALADVNLPEEALKLFAKYHISASNHYAQMALHALDKVTHSGLTLVTLVAIGYGVIRFIEAYGLWHGLRWTEWFAFLSGAIYLPFEIYELIKDPNIITIGVMVINIVVVSYMYYILKTSGGKHLKTEKEVVMSNSNSPSVR